MNNQELIDLYFARDEAAIAETGRRYGPMLRAIAYGILHNAADSEECENDSYLAAWNAIPPQRPRVLAAFLGRIARNIALDKYAYYGAEKRNRALETAMDELEELLPGGTDPAASCEQAELAGYITAYLRRQSRSRRQVFVRRYWYCDSVAQIAAAYGFSESKVKSMLMRMRNELKVFLERKGVWL